MKIPTDKHFAAIATPLKPVASVISGNTQATAMCPPHGKGHWSDSEGSGAGLVPIGEVSSTSSHQLELPETLSGDRVLEVPNNDQL